MSRLLGALLPLWILGAGGALAARVATFGRPDLAAGLLAGSVVAVVAWLVGGASQAPRRILVGATAVALGGGLVILLLPPGLLGHVVALAAPRTFATPAAVPLVIARLVAAQLAWGLALVAAAGVGAGAVVGRPGSLVRPLLAVFGPLAVWTGSVQSVTGDEPHYLLAARSLLRDGDADLTNDYGGDLAREFFPSDLLRRLIGRGWPTLDAHDVPGPRGERRPVHQLGYSALLLPGYALAGRAGAQTTAVLLALLGALAIAALVERCRDLGAGDFAVASLVLGSPLLAYSASLHAEPAGLAALTWLAVLAVTPAAERLRSGALAGGVAAAALLPWLHLKLVPAAALLVGYLAWDGLRARDARRWLPLAGLLLGLASQLAVFHHLYGSWSPAAPQLRAGGKYPGPGSGSLLVGLPGLLVDQQDGLWWVWPTGLLAVPGLLLAGRDGRVRRLAAVLGLHLLLLATYRLWGAGHAPAGRQLLPILGLTAPLVAAGATAVRGWRPGLVRGLVALNVVVVCLYAWAPRLRYPLVGADGLAHGFILGRLPGDWVNRLVPVVTADPLAAGVGWVYLGAILAVSWAGARDGRRRQA